MTELYTRECPLFMPDATLIEAFQSINNVYYIIYG